MSKHDQTLWRSTLEEALYTIKQSLPELLATCILHRCGLNASIGVKPIQVSLLNPRKLSRFNRQTLEMKRGRRHPGGALTIYIYCIYNRVRFGYDVFCAFQAYLLLLASSTRNLHEYDHPVRARPAPSARPTKLRRPTFCSCVDNSSERLSAWRSGQATTQPAFARVRRVPVSVRANDGEEDRSQVESVELKHRKRTGSEDTDHPKSSKIYD